MNFIKQFYNYLAEPTSPYKLAEVSCAKCNKKLEGKQLQICQAILQKDSQSVSDLIKLNKHLDFHAYLLNPIHRCVRPLLLALLLESEEIIKLLIPKTHKSVFENCWSSQNGFSPSLFSHAIDNHFYLIARKYQNLKDAPYLTRHGKLIVQQIENLYSQRTVDITQQISKYIGVKVLTTMIVDYISTDFGELTDPQALLDPPKLKEQDSKETTDELIAGSNKNKSGCSSCGER